jgi:predicted DNA-binding transcriptional regulator AlpA
METTLRYRKEDRNDGLPERAALSANKAAEFLDIGRSTFYEIRKSDKTFPEPAVIRGRRVYVKQHLLDWLLRQIPVQACDPAAKPGSRAERG